LLLVAICWLLLVAIPRLCLWIILGGRRLVSISCSGSVSFDFFAMLAFVLSTTAYSESNDDSDENNDCDDDTNDDPCGVGYGTTTPIIVIAGFIIVATIIITPARQLSGN
jgi:hypothetical protein